jgi:hypothetical protein
MQKNNLLTLILIIGFILSACSEVTPEVVAEPTKQIIATPTQFVKQPSVEVIEITPIPTNTPTQIFITPTVFETPSGTSIPPIVVEQPTPEATLQVDPTLQNLKVPLSLIQIEMPGKDSQVASPISIQAGVYPGDGGLISVQLYGENGRLMADQLLKMIHTESGWVQLVTEIKFEITSAGESGLIIVSTRDEFGRRIAQNSVPIVLLQIGKSEVEMPDFLKQPFVVQSQAAGAVVRNGILRISGFAHPFNSNPIVIELVTQTGGILASKALTLPKIASDQEYAPFTLDLPYKVSTRTPVRLTIRQRSDSLPALDVALSSQILYLDP